MKYRNLALGLMVCLSSQFAFAGKSLHAIHNRYETLEEVQKALRAEGLESSNLIIGIDYTKSNNWSGERTYGKENSNLHILKPNYFNPYQQVISVIGKTLAEFDDDQLIPTYGFGDFMTKDFGVFSLKSENGQERPCVGFQDVLNAYSAVTPRVRMLGPTSFVPIVRKAIEHVRATNNSYHILVIITDGVVTDMASNHAVLREAAEYPLSIVTVGVGDGEGNKKPGEEWAAMESFDDEVDGRKFDNFQFVNFNKVMSEWKESVQLQDANFAAEALQEIPVQFGIIKQLGLLGKK